jgi:CubicO group peptidase (beta-lactamase class C family)
MNRSSSVRSSFRRLRCFTALVVLSAAVSTTPQASATTTPREASVQAGFSVDRLARLEKSMNDWVQRGWIPGCVALVIRDGHVAFFRAAGYDDVEARKPLQTDAIFRIASQTKAVTSVAIMMLMEDGRLLLDDPVSKYLPAYRKQQVLASFNAADGTTTTVPAKRDITIRDLLTHTSGLGYAVIGSREATTLYGKANIPAGLGVHGDDLLAAMHRLAAIPLMHQPGERWTYGLNTDLLGCLVEQISGQSLDAFFRERIFQPLGMNDTYFRVPDAKAGRLVQLYRETSAGKLEKHPGQVLGDQTIAPNYPLEDHTYFSGGAGLSSTISDYGAFLQMLLNGGTLNGHRILSASSVRLMTQHQIGTLGFNSAGDDFGLGFGIVSERSERRTPSSRGTFSWGGAFATSYWVDPTERMVFILYRQVQPTTKGEVVELFRNLVYQAIESQAKSTPSLAR